MYKQGDIILVPFPFSDHLTTTKQRPAVIISKDSLNHNRYIVAKITSVLGKSNHALPIFKKDIDFELHKASQINADEIFTLSESLIIKKIGAFRRDALERLVDVVKDNFKMK